ncbi:hypothetical protein [Adoxophyes orana nucleopolyhedrovirus]|uniref:hypothetical protein n=1 Tax=Adoxophyes orana nucleopolyhedrovirus TaxID=542343 RepID=UPI0001829C26|nr:hypothetical protein [Adoxophyes orana nucleopolyhedrovirus]ACF05379.1 hypothetical protein [Adoxophyes orana nucleopolyhedrovirus]
MQKLQYDKNSLLATIIDLNVLSDLSDRRYESMFCKLSNKLTTQTLNRFVYGNLELTKCKNILNIIIKTEQLIRNKSVILNLIVNFLIRHSDGVSFQCMLNTKLLGYFLETYYNNNSNA